MPEQQPSFTRGIFAGVVLDSLLFPYPRPLDKRDAAALEKALRAAATA